MASVAESRSPAAQLLIARSPILLPDWVLAVWAKADLRDTQLIQVWTLAGSMLNELNTLNVAVETGWLSKHRLEEGGWPRHLLFLGMVTLANRCRSLGVGKMGEWLTV